jgi:hypothetical protein
MILYRVKSSAFVNKVMKHLVLYIKKQEFLDQLKNDSVPWRLCLCVVCKCGCGKRKAYNFV